MHASQAGSNLDYIEKATEYNKRIEELIIHKSQVGSKVVFFNPESTNSNESMRGVK